MSHLVEDCYFQEIEFFFLIVGHTHNILDQWFGVLSRAIRGANFIGSYLAMHELYKIAHSEEEADLRPQKVHQLELYHDWRRFYNPVRNTDIHHYGLPHRFKITLDPQLKVAKMQYMFMSPTRGFRHLEKWQPVPTAADFKTSNVDGDIPLSPLVIFNGPETVLRALGTSGKTNFTDLAIGDEKVRAKAANMTFIMPVLRQIELRAIGELGIRLEQEADTGTSEEHIHLSAALIKKIDSEITLNNSSKGGRIVWLRRSKIVDDPDYLNRRPDILPNPKLWNERIANAPQTSQAEASTETTTQPSRISADEIAKNKKLTADATESQLRFVHFQKGAAEMALTATHVLKLFDDGEMVKSASHNNIVVATKNFSRLVLTPREVAMYRSISSARSIAAKVEAQVEVALKQPWSLLNLPLETPEQQAHRESLLIARKARLVQVEANLRKILMRDGEGEYNPDRQVVAMDGFTPALTVEVDKMIRPQLEALAKGHLKPTEMKKLKVNELRAEVKKLIEKFPDLIRVPTARPISQETSDATSSTINGHSAAVPGHSMDIADGIEVEAGTMPVPLDAESDNKLLQKCCVVECDSINPKATILCDECNLYFCCDMHALHSSHSKQYLLPGKIANKVCQEIVIPALVSIMIMKNWLCSQSNSILIASKTCCDHSNEFLEY